jgi:hypothetical protein
MWCTFAESSDESARRSAILLIDDRIFSGSRVSSINENAFSEMSGVAHAAVRGLRAIENRLLPQARGGILGTFSADILQA